MDKKLDIRIEEALGAYWASGVEEQVDYLKFYLYSIVTHSTAIEGSTVTEIENQLLFDEGIAANAAVSKSHFDTLNCTLEELAVLKAIEGNPKITQTEIAKDIKKSASTVKRITSALVVKGILMRRNGRRNGWWEINQTES